MNQKRLGILAVITLATVGIVWATCPPDDNKWFWGMIMEPDGTGIPGVTVTATPCSDLDPSDCSPYNLPKHAPQSDITDALGVYQIGDATQNLHLAHHTVMIEVEVPVGYEACPGNLTTIYVDTLCGENRYDFHLCQPPPACRVTGGGVDTDGNWDGSLAQGRSKKDRGWNRYTFGGQAGAPTATSPPMGEWTHHQQSGIDGSFIFHAGTASAPEGTEIALIECSDPGWCVQARPAPFKQIDFEGVGTFKNIKNPSASLSGVVPGETFHWFEVHIEDLGEPGKSGRQFQPSKSCPGEGSAGTLANCDCPDFYRITIYAGSTDPTSLDKTTVIYEVYGYINGGNLQIHPPIH